MEYKATTRLIVSVFILLSNAAATDAVDDEDESVEEAHDWFKRTTETHSCRRPCVKGVKQICHFTISVELYYAMSKACYDCPNTLEDCYREDCIALDGVPRPVLVANRQFPGPTIEVCLGDTIVVDVENKMNDATTSIHWHGHHQVGTPYMDGVPFVTQCPISPNSVFRYTMSACNRGTHFWHAHTGVQRGDGLFGSMIVRTPDSEEPHISLYDQDLTEHIIIINDWTHMAGAEKLLADLQGTGDNKADTILVNGMGRFYIGSASQTNTPLAVFIVEKGQRYRFRMINSGINNCPIELNIDDHNVTAIATDGFAFDPVKVESLVSYAGERWDFVVNADKPVDNYWIRFTGMINCNGTLKAHQLAVLHYRGAPKTYPNGPVGYNVHPKSKLELNALNVAIDHPGTISVPLLQADKVYDDHVLHSNDVHRIYLSYDFNPVDHPMYHKPNAYGFKEVDKKYQRYTPQLNHTTFKFPSAPLLSQINDVDTGLFCANQNLEKCKEEFCECINIINIPLNTVVELILIDNGKPYNANHPFHLHGYAFRVVGMDRVSQSVSEEFLKRLDKEGGLVRNLDNPPLKDTVTVPDGGYTILRFHATNPGYWLFHCHIEVHLEAGMAVVFKIGDKFPDIPKGFPKCGNFNNIKK